MNDNNIIRFIDSEDERPTPMKSILGKTKNLVTPVKRKDGVRPSPQIRS